MKEKADLELYCQLKNKSLSKNDLKQLYNYDDIRTCQRLDTKIKAAIDSINGNKESLKVYRPRRDSIWTNGLKNKLFFIKNGILFYNDKKKINLIDKDGRIVAPDKHKIVIVKHYHFNGHNGIDNTLELIERRYWWQDMKQDVELIVKSCENCNEGKGNCGTMSMNSWTPSAPGEIVFYDFGGPYFKLFYIGTFLDGHSGKVMFSVVLRADAITVCDILLQRWIPDQGFPIQLGSDMGSSNLNDLMDIFFEITGIHSFFASPRRHQSIGKVENAIKIMNKHMRSLNIDLNGQLTDKFNRSEALQRVRMYLPSIEFNMNERKCKRTGMSANQLDKGRSLRGIGDAKLALEKLKQMVKENSPKHDQLKYLQDLQKRILLYQTIRNGIEYSYLFRNMNKHELNNTRNYKYKKDEYVGYYIGDRASTAAAWPRARGAWSAPSRAGR
jgi:hypothetical protein